MWNPFAKSKRYLGIDVGTSSLKVVELKGSRKSSTLTNYASCHAPAEERKRGGRKEGFLRLSVQQLSQVLVETLKEAEIEAGKAAISVPIYSTFTTVITVPADISEDNLQDAIKFEAKKHVPVPFSEVTLEWHFIETISAGNENEQQQRKVFVIAIPNDLVDKYQSLGGVIADFNIELLEIEVFSTARVLRSYMKMERPVVMVDMGGKNTNVTIIKNGTMVDTFNLNISGEDLSRELMDKLDLSFDKAVKLKEKKGLQQGDVKRYLTPSVEDLAIRVKRKLRAKIEDTYKVVLTGGASRLPGLQDFLEDKLGKRVELVRTWSKVDYPDNLESKLQNSSPSYTVACGLALRGLA